jgi:predicted NACHT family NTPase
VTLKIEDPQVIVNGLQNLMVSELGQTILRPLFQKIYDCQVEFVAGSCQKGSDLIVHKSDELGDPATLCVQVRRISPDDTPANRQSEQKLINQMAQLHQQGVISNVIGGTLKVAKIILVTPFLIEKRLTDSNLEALSNAIKTHNVRLVDGLELANLIIKHHPELLYKFVEKCYLIKQSVRNTLNNEMLLKAFNLENAQANEDGYCEISVIPGGKYNLEHFGKLTSADYLKQVNVRNTQLNLPLRTLDCSIEDLFDSGENIAVLGDAGSGKTTNLQHYASKLLDSDTDKLVIYTTLNKIAACADALSSQSILDGMVGYLLEISTKISISALSDHFTQQPSVVILDSVDEAIVEFDWVIEALIAFSQSFPLCQIITSSRYSVEKLSDIPFFHLSILPLNDSQKNQFVKKWFAKDTIKADEVINHLAQNPQLSEIVTNPLSATILCVLCQNNIPLPKSEAALYKKRIEMLCGLFDHYKGIKRTKIEPDILMDVARVIAFGMHIRKRSNFDKSFALQVCLNFFTDPQQTPMIKAAVEALISPCEVIVPSIHGDYDFGHLRFQEFLASEELVNRRNISLKELLKDNWWDETFVLLSQHAREIESVVNQVCETGNIIQKRPLLMKMFSSRSSREREIFTKRVNQSQFHNYAKHY